MHIILEQLQHQQVAIEKILDFLGKNGIYRETKSPYGCIDIKMETGTGKTYVYTRLMYELNQKYGLKKFIILTPSLAIKEGTKAFLQSESAMLHFRDMFPTQRLESGLVNAGDFTAKKGRKTIPNSLREFCLDGSFSCLLFNDGMLTSPSLKKNDYETNLTNSTNVPLEALKLTKPVVIIDEPHRFSRENTAWKTIMELEPLLLFRFGATFPNRTVSKGKTKKTEVDYDNLVYELNAVDSFNQGLVKGIDVYYPAIDNTAKKYKVAGITKEKLTLRCGAKDYDVLFNEALNTADADFPADLTYYRHEKDCAVLNTGQELYKGMTMIPATYQTSYQEILLQQAVEKHFETEQENFFRTNSGVNAPKVKTLSLFFIDSIASFRGNHAWLRNKFEELLKAKLQELIKEYKTGGYHDFLTATLQNIGEACGGYFAEDQSAKKDEDKIAAEVDDILRNKEKLLTFRDERGNWNVRRFLFSKWTLKEGWDNPNVFVITKLRTSGSENSKLQEVGRGLRLPVDEKGRRLSDEEFRLAYLIDFSEKDFAAKLIGEINKGTGILKQGKITDEILQILVDKGYGATKAKAKGKLLNDDIIDEHDTITNIEDLIAIAPDELNKIGDKVRENPRKPKRTVKLRKEKFAAVKELWEKICKRYVLQFQGLSDDEMEIILSKMFTAENFKPQTITIKKQSVSQTPTGADLSGTTETPIESQLGIFPFNVFIKRLHERTSLPVMLLAERTLKTAKSKNELNENTLENICKSFTNEFITAFAQKYTYSALDFSADTSLVKDGEAVDEVAIGTVGNDKVNIPVPLNYFWEEIYVDSGVEGDIVKQQMPNTVVTFGKLPRRSIRVPLYTGGTTSPDFVFAVHKNSGTKLYLLVEAKSEDKRTSENIATSAQKRFFDSLGVSWQEITQGRDIDNVLRKVI